MQDYDVSLKVLLRGPASATLRELIGSPVANWIDIELPKVQNLKLDLLGESSADQSLIHLELQSTNDGTMPLRMLEYYTAIHRMLGRFPRQVLLYVGEEPLRMNAEFRSADLWFRYHAIDIRSLDGERLLESPEFADNVIAILTKLRDHRDAVRRIVERAKEWKPRDRETALSALLVLGGLRHLEEFVEQEIQKMPIHIDILQNKVLGREYKRGELTVLRRQIQKRFGPLPDWAEERLAGRSPGELEELSERVLDAKSLNELLT